MLTPSALAAAYDRNFQIIKMQTAGLSQAESLILLPFRGNCMNWVVGHILTNRLNVFKLLEVPLPFMRERIAGYERESETLNPGSPGVLALEELLALLERSQTTLAESLATLTPEVLENSVAFFGRKRMSVAEWLMFFYFHDTYHTGQTEILRQAAGKDDKII